MNHKEYLEKIEDICHQADAGEITKETALEYIFDVIASWRGSIVRESIAINEEIENGTNF